MVAGVGLLIAAAAISGASRKFYDDDPIAREPESQDASGAKSSDVGLFYDFTRNLFVTPRRTPTGRRAQNVNTIDEVPDSSWFTNRIDRGLATADLVRGGTTGRPPNPSSWTVIREKSSGFAPGFTARDADGETWFVSFDPPSNPEGATAAILVATRLFWALGYNQVESFLTTVNPEGLTIGPKATTMRSSGERTPITHDDLARVFRRSARNPDGTYRAAAGRALKGSVLGPFRYEGTRPDDPNDIVPHEHRRELRALRVFGAWTNLTDLKAGNTLDVLEPSGGRQVVRHYLQDVGSTFGIGANGPHDWDEGFEYFYEGGPTLRRLLSFGFALSPWQTARYEEFPAVGRFGAEPFDPLTWKPHAPTHGYVEMRDDDAFWAARRVAAFTDQQIRDAVATGQFSDAAAAAHLANVLIARRDAISRAYLPRVTPIVNPALDSSGTLTFGNAAVEAKLAAPAGYEAAWSRFDNLTGETQPIGESRAAGPRLAAPAALPATPGEYLRIVVKTSGEGSSTEAAQKARPPATIFFRRTASGWALVGLERLPDRIEPPS